MRDFKVQYTCTAVVPKLGVNYLPGIICDSSGGNAKLKSHCCSISVFLKVGGITPLGVIFMGKGAKKTKGAIWGRKSSTTN